MRFLRTRGITTEPRVFLRDVREPMLSELLGNNCSLFVTTVAEGDLMIVPVQSVCLEDIGPSDCMGIKFGVLLGNDKPGCAHFQALSTNAATPATHVSKAVARVLALGATA